MTKQNNGWREERKNNRIRHYKSLYDGDVVVEPLYLKNGKQQGFKVIVDGEIRSHYLSSDERWEFDYIFTEHVDGVFDFKKYIVKTSGNKTLKTHRLSAVWEWIEQERINAQIEVLEAEHIRCEEIVREIIDFGNLDNIECLDSWRANKIKELKQLKS